MGAKLVGPKGKGNGKGKKGGGNVPANTGLISVNLTVSVAKALLGSLTTGIAPPQDVAKTVALALVRALSVGPITKKKSGKKIGKKVVGKKVVGKKGAPIIVGKKGPQPLVGARRTP
jgi:hypothetical protein